MVDIYDGVTIVTEGEGPPGTPARAGVAVSFSNGYHANEVLPGAVAVAPITVTGTASAFVSRTKPTGVVTFAINQNTVQIGTANMDPATCGPGPVYRGVVTLTTEPVQIAVNDLIDWTAPASVDATFTGGALTLGSPP